MNREELFNQIIQKKSFLCIGLDTDITKIPRHLLDAEDPVFEFNRQIIEATQDYCVAYKPNLAFYESMGPRGLQSLEKTMFCIPENIFTIADAKRGDIGNTAQLYGQAYFDYFHFDAITVAPYMGEDSVKPFLSFKNKWVILLALTSNEGSADFQVLPVHGKNGDVPLFEEVLMKSKQWGDAGNMMYVAGATQASHFKHIRKIVPDHFLLVPGIGAQGGSMQEVAKYGMNSQCGLLVNSSRQIIYASQGKDFAQKAKQEAQKVQAEMEKLLDLL
jgi:orotidine-5'-phosphate decarboxylase